MERNLDASTSAPADLESLYEFCRYEDGAVVHRYFGSLDSETFLTFVEAELRKPSVALRTDERLAADEKRRKKEATKPELHLQRRIFEGTSFAGETIVWREFPIGPHDRGGLKSADLITRGPEGMRVIELKQGEAADTLCGTLAQAAFYWAFLARHREELGRRLDVRSTKAAGGYPNVGLAAPRKFFAQARGRSSKRRHGFDDFVVATRLIDALQGRYGIDITLFEIDEVSAAAQPWHDPAPLWIPLGDSRGIDPGRRSLEGATLSNFEWSENEAEHFFQTLPDSTWESILSLVSRVARPELILRQVADLDLVIVSDSAIAAIELKVSGSAASAGRQLLRNVARQSRTLPRALHKPTVPILPIVLGPWRSAPCDLISSEVLTFLGMTRAPIPLAFHRARDADGAEHMLIHRPDLRAVTTVRNRKRTQSNSQVPKGLDSRFRAHNGVFSLAKTPADLSATAFMADVLSLRVELWQDARDALLRMKRVGLDLAKSTAVARFLALTEALKATEIGVQQEMTLGQRVRLTLTAPPASVARLSRKVADVLLNSP